MFSFAVMENYKNVPQYFYGLTTSQMDMFMTEDNPFTRQAERVTEVISLNSLISAHCASKWLPNDFYKKLENN